MITVLHGETHMEITEMLANNVKNASEEQKEKVRRIYMNWIDFIGTLKSDGLFGLSSNEK